MDPLSDQKVVDSWLKNATPWTSAVRENRIESRKAVTNQAIIDVVRQRKPQSVLDIGCGEGWLARALAANGISVTGVDVVPELIESARRAGGGDFRVASYEMIAEGALEIPPVDLALANFSLIGEASVENLIRRTPTLLLPGGAFVMQTLHPLVACGDVPYVDGWRAGSWAGFSEDFTDPAPWYFRTLESWVRLFTSSGLHVVQLHEPLHPTSGRPASVIFVAQVAG